MQVLTHKLAEETEKFHASRAVHQQKYLEKVSELENHVSHQKESYQHELQSSLEE